MTNREEVAKRLREAGGYLDKNAPGDVNGAAQSVLFELFEATSVRDSNSYSDAFSRLADLIDPTCELKIQDGHACCGNCGHILAGEYESEEDYWCFRPYCPDCGTRVVRDEA